MNFWQLSDWHAKQPPTKRPKRAYFARAPRVVRKDFGCIRSNVRTHTKNTHSNRRKHIHSLTHSYAHNCTYTHTQTHNENLFAIELVANITHTRFPLKIHAFFFCVQLKQHVNVHRRLLDSQWEISHWISLTVPFSLQISHVSCCACCCSC